jgi:2-amino-4-hydroxy-6-hydroxymethyldihydropteridine diphosphokinase
MLPAVSWPLPVPVAIALGSNLGDRHAHLDFAISRLKQILEAVRVSTVIETDPVGVVDQPKFLNAAIVGRFDNSPRALLDALLRIERERGRERPFAGAPRTLDLDVVLFGDQVVDDPDLSVPHPRFRERRFVLEPLAEIAPNLIDPISGRTVEELWEELKNARASLTSS